MFNEESALEHIVTYQESDFLGHYRLSCLFSTMADLATKNAWQTNIWNASMQDKYGWILVKQTVQLERPVQSHETITLTSRAGNATHVQFTRYYDFYDASKICIGGAYSIWTFIDIHKRRIIKPKSVGITIPTMKEYQHAVEQYEPVEEDLPSTCVMQRKVSYSDLDINQHMNNYRYIEWAMDALPTDLLETYHLSSISTFYQKEMVAGTIANILFGRKGNQWKIQFVSPETAGVYFTIGGTLTADKR